ncbi:MAG TPA: helix-turn-helix domain-containing protein [Nocardioidaceae bacterium]|nr:helix-turn-helix domain-containing protein [Nocardioidaceae bacterium]
MSTTRDRLLDAGEQLFAEHGASGVSAREIVRLSGVLNASALQYHFGDREGLVQAVLDRHESEVEVRRHALLDAAASGGDPDLRGLVAALVLPLAAKLQDESGRRYLRLAAELVNRPGYRMGADDLPEGSSILRWRARLDGMLDADAIRLHRRFVVVRFVSVELGRRAAEDPAKDDALFVSQLIDLAVALLACPLSAESSRHLVRSARRD